jgi:hypothetical protein
MRLPFTPFLIRTPPSWTVVEKTLLNATEGRICQIRFVPSRAQVSADRTMLDVVKFPLTGAADFELEVHWKNRCRLGDDTVAYRLSQALEQPVIVPNRDANPPSWMMVTHDGAIYTPIHFNAELLERNRRVEFRIA